MASVSSLVGAIDCDIHLPTPRGRDLSRYFEDYWREHVRIRGLDKDSLEVNSYPPGSPLTARQDWRSPAANLQDELLTLQTKMLDHYKPRFAIANSISAAQMFHSEDLSAAFCHAVNEWMIAEWLEKEPRLRASIVVPMNSPELAAREIERLAGDKRFVQVLLLVMSEMPLGRRQNWPIYATAERHGLPIAIHAGSTYRHPTTSVGWPSYYIEDYVANSFAFANTLGSLLTEGVFVKFPSLKFVLMESGVTWLPQFLWRADTTWRSARIEVPWNKRSPSEVIRENVRLTLQPFDAPNAQEVIDRLMHQIGSDEMLLFSSDFPHWHFDNDEIVPPQFGSEFLRKIAFENPMATYSRLE